MYKLLFTLMSIFVLGLGSTFAQEDTTIETDVSEEGAEVVVSVEAAEGVDFDTNSYVGASVPLPLGFSTHYGLENVQLFGVEPDLRFRLSGDVAASSVNLGIDTLFDIAQLEENIQLYGGPGLELGTVFPLVPSFGLVGILGGEYRFNREIGFFAELGTNIRVPLDLRPRAALGVNYHF